MKRLENYSLLFYTLNQRYISLCFKYKTLMTSDMIQYSIHFNFPLENSTGVNSDKFSFFIKKNEILFQKRYIVYRQRSGNCLICTVKY